MKGFITAEEAAKKIKDGDSLALGGFLGLSLPEDIYYEMEKRFLETGHPNKLKLCSVAGLGGDGKVRGYNRFGHPGMVGELRCCNTTFCPSLQKLASDNDFPTWMYPQGVMAHMMRAIAGQQLGVVTKIGLKTYADPREDGCKMNQAAMDDSREVVKLIDIDGVEQLYYPAWNIDVAIIKGTYSDSHGNISGEHEAVKLEQYEKAAAAHNCGGIVIAQVDAIVEDGVQKPKDMICPGVIVDYVVVGRPDNSRQNYAFEEGFKPELTGEIRIPLDDVERANLDARKVIARRAAMLISKNSYVNLGVGVPTTISSVLNEEGLANEITFSIESGLTGGVPAGGLGTGAGFNPVCIFKQTETFDLYDGGGLDYGFLGAAQVDAHGNVNVSKFAGRVVGPGGFSNISQCARTIAFCGTFTNGKGAQIEVKDGKLNIIKDAEGHKFIEKCDQITWSGDYCREMGIQKAYFITERALFELKKEGVTLIEIAPGVDLQKDILDKMDFTPIISEDLKLMDERIFKDELMGLELLPEK